MIRGYFKSIWNSHAANGNSKLFLLFLLGMLTAFGPFVTDMYLPALPMIRTEFHTVASLAQMTLTTSMLGLAVGQIIFGPLSDRYGRRGPLLLSMLLFAAATVCCLFVSNIHALIVLRFLQGMGGAGGIVIARSVATDLYSGQQLAKILAIIGAINGVAPVAAPVVGGFLSESFGWKGIFIVLLVIGVLLAIGCWRFHESLPKENRMEGGLGTTVKNFGIIMTHRQYMAYTLQFALAQGILFGYIASSTFIIQEIFGYSESEFGIIFGINAIGIGLGAALAARFKRAVHCTFYSSCGMLLLSIVLLFALMNHCSFIVYEGLVFILLLITGLSFTSSTTLAMDAEHERAGAASALMGALGFAMGGLASPLVGIGGIDCLMLNSGILFVVCAVLAMVCTLWGQRAFRNW